MIELIKRILNVFKKEVPLEFIQYPIEKGSYKVTFLNGEIFYVDDKTIQNILNLRRMGEKNLLMRNEDNSCSNIYNIDLIIHIRKLEEIKEKPL
jgi:hypothetical protein